MGSSVATKLKLTSGGNLQIPVDNAKLQIGAGQDLFLEHDGNNSVFRNTTGDLYIQDNSAGTIFIQPVNNEGSITAIANGRVELAFDGGKKFETTAGGAIVTGTLDTTDTISSGNSNIKTNGDTGKFLAGASNDLQIYHDGSHSRIIDSGTGVLSLQSDNLRIHNVSANEYMAEFVENGAASLYFDNNKKLETTSTGVSVTGQLSLTADLNMEDGDQIEMGTDNDFKIFTQVLIILSHIMM